jgi:hypothetical protein
LRRLRVAETVVGLAVVVAIAAAAVAVRQRQAAREGAPAAGVPDVSRTDATLDLGDVRITVSAGPRPLLAFARNRFRFRAEKDGGPVPLSDGVVSFTMTMPMGDHRHALVAAPVGWHEAVAALPLCPSGNRRWFGTLDFTLEGRARSVRFAFDLEPPSATPGEGARQP